MVFDSGSSYTYFNPEAYRAVLDQVGGGHFATRETSFVEIHFISFHLSSINQLRRDLYWGPLKGATEDESLPVCWRGARPIRSVNDVKAYFKPLTLSFPRSVQYEIPPEAYLVITVSTSPSFFSFTRERYAESR